MRCRTTFNGAVGGGSEHEGLRCGAVERHDGSSLAEANVRGNRVQERQVDVPEGAGGAVLVHFVSVHTGGRGVQEHDLGPPALGDISGEGHAGAGAVAVEPGGMNEGVGKAAWRRLHGAAARLLQS